MADDIIFRLRGENEDLKRKLAEVRRAFNLTEEQVEELVRAAEHAGDEFAELGEEGSKGLGRLKITAGDLAGVIGALGLKQLIGESVDVAAKLESVEKAFEQVTGSAAEAKAELGFVRETADRLGIGLVDTANVWASLNAAARGTKLEGEPARDIFLAVSEAMATLGRSSAETRGALLAVEQIISKGTVSAEELRGQLGERIPGAFQLAARAAGVTTEELGDMLKSGEVLAEELLPDLARELRNAFNTSQSTRIETTAANLERARTAAADLKAEFGQAFLRQVSEPLSQASEAAASLGTTVEGLGRVSGFTANSLVGVFQVAAGSIGTVAGEAARGLTIIGQTATGVGAAVAEALGLDKLAENARRNNKLLNDLRESAKQFADESAADIIAGADRLKAAVDRLLEPAAQIPEVARTAKGELGGLGTAAEEAAEGTDDLAESMEKLEKASDRAASALGKVLAAEERQARKAREAAGVDDLEKSQARLQKRQAELQAQATLTADEMNELDQVSAELLDTTRQLEEASVGLESALQRQQREQALAVLEERKRVETLRDLEEALSETSDTGLHTLETFEDLATSGTKLEQSLDAAGNKVFSNTAGLDQLAFSMDEANRQTLQNTEGLEQLAFATDEAGKKTLSNVDATKKLSTEQKRLGRESRTASKRMAESADETGESVGRLEEKVRSLNTEIRKLEEGEALFDRITAACKRTQKCVGELAGVE